MNEAESTRAAEMLKRQIAVMQREQVLSTFWRAGVEHHRRAVFAMMAKRGN